MVMIYSKTPNKTSLHCKPKVKGRRLGYYLLAIAWFTMPTQLFSAEIRGEVNFKIDSGAANNLAIKDIPITIALFPLDGQILPEVQARTHLLNISNKYIDPVYITIPRNDKVQFVNNDKFIHQFQLLANGRKEKLVLAGKGRGDASRTIRFEQNGRTHIFCNIHAGTYGRIDVIDTPYIKVISGPGMFEFKDIEAGRWQLRVTAPGSDLAVEVAEAFTAPPPVKVALRFYVIRIRDTDDIIMKKLTSLFPE